MATSLSNSTTIAAKPVRIVQGSTTFDPRAVVPHLAITDARKLIKAKYDSVGSILGKSVSDVQGLADQLVFFQNFANGCIVATALQASSVFEIHGAIYGKWNEMGRFAYGLPMTDETSTPDATGGRYNHFTGGRSIYWRQDTGAHAIYGDIRMLWAQNGWERSELGFPVSDEMNAPDGVGRQVDFQYGSIYWAPDTGAYVLPETLTWSGQILTPGINALGGNYEITLYRNGHFIFKGALTDTGYEDYDAYIAAILIDPYGFAYSFEHSSHTVGRLFGSDTDNWVNAGYNESIAKNWGKMKFAQLPDPYFTFEGAITSVLEDKIGEALKKLLDKGIEIGTEYLIRLVAA